MRKLMGLLVLIPFFAFGQGVSLDSLQSAAEKNWPSFKKRLSIAEENDLVIQILKRNYIPKVTVTGQATYQSEVISFPEVQIPGQAPLFPELPFDNYAFEANLTQILYDGGQIKAGRQIQEASAEVQQKNVDVEVYDLKGKIQMLYLKYLLLEQTETILKLSISELDENLKIMQVGIDNGVLLEADKDHLTAQKIQILKQLISLESGKKSILKALSIMSGVELSLAVQFEKPEVKSSADLVRPELQLLDAQINLTATNMLKLNTVPIPKLVAFGKLGYGRPGFDMINTKMHGYYMVGAKFTWDIWGWNSLKKQKDQIYVKTNMIEHNKEMLTKKIAIEHAELQEEIDKYEKQIELSEEIEKLTENVYKTGQSKFNNGTINSTEYLKLFNDLNRARLTTEADKLGLLQAKLDWVHAQGVKK
ncbi:MAG: TolC family protein [Crocinitomicaceae bacterium]|nr:TolC family protein [Crocinitomicaceae bacterium]